MATSKEDIMAKAAAKLAAMKSTTADAPVISNTPKVPVQLKTPDPMPTAKFWCSLANQILYPSGLNPIKFKGNDYSTNKIEEIRFLQEMARNHPHKFKFLG